MPEILKNNILEIHIDPPGEGYHFSRFDWTGKITQLKYQDIPITTTERTDPVDPHLFGKGLYNEFGIDTALGFEETQPGEWFHKIGVGALKKTDGPYQFTTPYEIRPAEFHFEMYTDKALIRCESASLNGYAYQLTKEFRLQENRLIISYQLKNTGQKAIVTDEYVHNFMGVDQGLVSKDYVLSFPFRLNQKEFQALVNPEMKMVIGNEEISFNGNPTEQFFISHLNGKTALPALWELQHLKSGTGIREKGSFSSQKINLWGWKHVISPELFYQISIGPGETASWSRHYECFAL